ncbi:Retrotransposon-derived protein peg10 [Savitreella phatthalungensis]
MSGASRGLAYPEFSGNPQQLKGFLARLKIRLNIDQVTDEFEKVSTACGCLQGKVYDWGNSVAEATTEGRWPLELGISSFDSFCKVLRAEYQEKDAAWVAAVRLMHLKQTGTLTEYNDAFQVNRDKVAWNDRALADHYRNGLAPWIAERLSTEPREKLESLTSLREVVRKIQEHETVNAIQRAGRGSGPRVKPGEDLRKRLDEPRKKTTEDSNTKASDDDVVHVQIGAEDGASKKRKYEGEDDRSKRYRDYPPRDYSNMRCYACNERGHISTYCPTRTGN